jgi:DNA-binding SARP family transcriptional activator
MADKGREAARLGTLILGYRQAARLSQQELAGRAAISVGAVRDLEQGRTRRPRPGSLAALAAALGLSPAQAGELRRASTGGAWLQVLGPLRAWQDGLLVPLGGPERRAVLGLLTMAEGSLVHRTAIVDALWPDDPPANAVRLVQAHVSRLRRALEPGRLPHEPDGLLTASGASYRLRAGPGQLDLLAFRRLTEAARAAGLSGDQEAAFGQYRQALDLWRGDPLADVELLCGHPAVAGLARQRDEVVIEYARAASAVGRHDQVLTALRDLVAREPLNEQAHAQLMIALAGCGQQAEALAAYHDLCRRLDDELAIRPGPGVAGAHQLILRQSVPAARAAVAAASVGEASPAVAPGKPEPRPPRNPAPRVTDRVRDGRAGERVPADHDRPGEPDEQAAGPGEGLRERILASGAGQGALSSAFGVSRSQPAAAMRPRQLPTAPGSFVGRQAELDLLGSLEARAGRVPPAAGAVRVWAIDGMAGVGKTALAVEAAHRLARKFPSGQLFADLRGYTQGCEPRAAGEVLGWFLRALGVRQIPEETDERAALFRHCLAGRRTLIVLDNAVSEAQVRPLLPGGAGCLVLITSRRRLKGLDDAQILALDVLPQADSVTLLRAVAGPERAAADPLLAEVAGLCGGLPLALRVAAALLRHRPAWTLEHLAGLLRDQQDRIGALSDGERDVGAVFDLSYQSLPEACRRLFCLLGLIPGPDLDAYAAAALAASTPASTTRLLEHLTDHNLVIQHAPGRYCLHDLIRLHARALAARAPASVCGVALDQLLDYYQHTAGRANALVTPGPQAAPAGPGPAHAPVLQDPDAAWTWLRAELPNLLATVQHASSHAQPRRAITLTADLAPLLYVDGPLRQAVALHTAAASMAESLGDQRDLACALTELARAGLMTRGHHAAVSDLERALEIYKRLGDRSGQGYVLLRLADARRLKGDHDGAAGDLERALEIYKSLGERRGQARALAQHGDMRRVTGDYPAAVAGLEHALEIYRDLGERSGQGYVLLRLGDVRRLIGDFPGAVADLEHCLEIYKSLGERRGQADALTWLVMVRLLLTGDCQGETADLRHAFEIYADIGDLNGQAQVLTVLGRARRSAGDLQDAASHLETALDTFRRLGHSTNEAWALNDYAAVIAATGDHEHARSLYQDSLRLARETSQPDEEALALEGVGECHLRADDGQLSIAHLEQALNIFQRLGMKFDAERVRTRITQLRGSSETGAHPNARSL